MSGMLGPMKRSSMMAIQRMRSFSFIVSASYPFLGILETKVGTKDGNFSLEGSETPVGNQIHNDDDPAAIGKMVSKVQENQEANEAKDVKDGVHDVIISKSRISGNFSKWLLTWRLRPLQ